MATAMRNIVNGPGTGLILLELHSHSFGVLAVAGLVCVIVGSILLVPTSYPQWYLPGEYQRSIAAAFILPSLILGADQNADS